MGHPLVTAPNFVSVTPSMGVFFPFLRRGKVSTLWSSFFLRFMRLARCILYLGYRKFWASIHLSVSTYCASSFVIGLPHSGWCPSGPSICFCKAKDTVNKIKKPPTGWQRIFTYHKSGRGLISNIYKELKKVDSRKSNNPIKNGAQSLTNNSHLRNTKWLRST